MPGRKAIEKDEADELTLSIPGCSVRPNDGAVSESGFRPREVLRERRDREIFLAGGLVVLATILLSLLFYSFAADQVIRSMREGTSFGFLNRLIKDHSSSLEYDLTRGKLIFSHLVTTTVALELLVLAILLRRRTWRLLKGFFTAADHPVNLALFRIVVFWRLILWTDLSEISWYSRIPRELQFAPWGMGTILKYLPITERWATITTVLLLLFAISGLAGFFSRLSAFLCLILGLYCLGIPQFYGKVNHYHHLLWFCAILAASPCGDFLSVDSIFQGWKRAAKGITTPPGASRAYALPLRFVWLLLGIMYFFPGFWKLWQGGFAWALSDNLHYKLHLKWTELHWVPSFRIDRFSLLCQVGAAATICFELSVLLLIFFPKLRLVIPFLGVAFHNLNGFFMQIGFSSLQWSYVALFNWNSIFRTVGRRLYRDQMYILYDGSCGMCRRTIASLRAFDIFERITYLSNSERGVLDPGVSWPTPAAVAKDIYAVVQNKSWSGFLAYRRLASRIPILWPLVPFLYLWPVPTIGSRMYRYVADSRTCSIAPAGSAVELGKIGRQMTGIVAVGLILVIANLECGIEERVSGWPFACYPTFALITTGETKILSMVALAPTGESIPFRATEMSSERLLGLNSKVLFTRDQTLRTARLKAIWRLWIQNNPDLRRAASVRFYEDTIRTDPELWDRNPVSRKLVLNLDPAAL